MNNYAKALISGKCSKCNTEVVRVYLRINGHKHILLWCPNCEDFIIPPRLIDNKTLERKLMKIRKKFLDKVVIM